MAEGSWEAEAKIAPEESVMGNHISLSGPPRFLGGYPYFDTLPYEKSVRWSFCCNTSNNLQVIVPWQSAFFHFFLFFAAVVGAARRILQPQFRLLAHSCTFMLQTSPSAVFIRSGAKIAQGYRNSSQGPQSLTVQCLMISTVECSFC